MAFELPDGYRIVDSCGSCLYCRQLSRVPGNQESPDSPEDFYCMVDGVKNPLLSGRGTPEYAAKFAEWAEGRSVDANGICPLFRGDT